MKTITFTVDTEFTGTETAFVKGKINEVRLALSKALSQKESPLFPESDMWEVINSAENVESAIMKVFYRGLIKSEPTIKYLHNMYEFMAQEFEGFLFNFYDSRLEEISWDNYSNRAAEKRRVSALPYVASPYEPGVSRRKDFAAKQFEIIAHGRMSYIEDDPRNGMFSLDGCARITNIADITSAVLLAEKIYNLDAWEYRDPHVDYYDSELGHDCGPQSFSFQYLTIVDRYGKTVMNAEHGSAGLRWVSCIFDGEAVAKANTEIEDLRAEGREERRWDNFDCARYIEVKADKIRARIVTTTYNWSVIIEELRIASMMSDDELKDKFREAVMLSDIADRSLFI